MMFVYQTSHLRIQSIQTSEFALFFLHVVCFNLMIISNGREQIVSAYATVTVHLPAVDIHLSEVSQNNPVPNWECSIREMLLAVALM